MLLAFQRAIIWRWQNLYEVGAPCEVKEFATDTEFKSITFDELWTLYSTLLIFIFSFNLFGTLIAFQNAKVLLIWSVYANLVVI